MAKKRRVRVDRVIIVILTGILIVGLLGFGIYKLIGFLMNSNLSPVIDNTPQVQTSEDINIEQVSYKVYKDDSNSLGFNFVLAEIKFTGKDNVSFNLNDLQTSEKLSLGDIGSYLKGLKDASYNIDQLNIVDVISSKDKEYIANIFIPYKTDSDFLHVYNINDPKTDIAFDLNRNVNYFTSLKFDNKGQEIKVEDTNVYVSHCSISTTMVHNGEEYYIGSTNKVFTFKISVKEVKDDVSIVDAYFIREDDNENVPCMSSEYSSIKVKNILGKTLKIGENGALFFEMYAPEQEPNYNGALMIKFSNSNDWVKLSTNLQ